MLLNVISGWLVTGDVCQSASQIGLIGLIFVAIIITIRSKCLRSELDLTDLSTTAYSKVTVLK